ncbi:hypothetical protein U9M48_008802 [Paspalum notatum var. saurae]|uniref:Uncharacterized protein n=1 Tax=Paspalum notatum var. saurae TaxID=547442 RepID=A0AAQ3WE03_PASNO
MAGAQCGSGAVARWASGGERAMRSAGAMDAGRRSAPKVADCGKRHRADANNGQHPALRSSNKIVTWIGFGVCTSVLLIDLKSQK